MGGQRRGEGVVFFQWGRVHVMLEIFNNNPHMHRVCMKDFPWRLKGAHSWRRSDCSVGTLTQFIRTFCRRCRTAGTETRNVDWFHC